MSDLVKRLVLPRANRRTYARCVGDHIGQVVDGSVEGTWKCGTCGAINQAYHTHAVQFVPFWHEHLGHEPVYVDSWKTYKSILKQRGWHNVLAD